MVRGLEKFLAKKMEATRGEEGGHWVICCPFLRGITKGYTLTDKV